MQNIKILVATLLIIIAAACTEEKKPIMPYSALPDQAVAVVTVNDVLHATDELKDNFAYASLRELPFFSKLENNLSSYHYFFNNREESRFLKNRDFYGALALSGASQYQMMWVTSLENKQQSQKIKELLQKEKHETYRYAEVEVVHLKPENSAPLFVASTQKLLLFSASKTLIEQSIRQIQAQYSFLSKPEFKAIQSTANRKDPLNLYIEYEGFVEFLKTQLAPGKLGFFSDLAGWGEWDVQASRKELILSGISQFEDGQGYFWEIFKDIDAQKVSATRILPGQLALSVSYTFQNYGQYQRAYRRMLDQRQNLVPYLEKLKSLQYPDSIFLQYVDNELGLFYNGTGSNGSAAIAYLKLLDTPASKKLGETISDLNYVEGFRAQIIKRMKLKGVLPAVFGPIFKQFKQPYFCQLGNFVIFSDDVAALKGVISDHLDRKTLEQSNSFANFYSSMPQEVHVQVLASNPQTLNLLPQVLRQDAASLLQKHRDSIKNIQWGGLQVKVNDNSAFTSLYFKKTPAPKLDLARRWTAQLDNPPIGAPQILKNHRNGKYDVAIQDAKNNLYLLDHSGSIFWKIALDGPIMGSITQVDLYKNGNLQMVFNTAQSLYVVDRLGRPVRSFPVQLPQKATAPAGVFDYDGNRRYRFVVPCGKMLYNYNRSGRQTPGWEFKEAPSKLISKPQFFSVQNRDIIVCLSRSGKVYQLNRRGQERFKLEQSIEELKSRFFLKPGATLKKSELLANSTSGRLYVLSPYTKIDTIQLEKGRPADYFLYFNDSYIFSSGPRLYVKNDRHPFMAEFKDEISDLPKALLYRDQFYVGAYSAAAEEIRLYNSKGHLLSGFPVFAQGPFDMGSLQRNGLLDIVSYSNDGTVVCYTVE